jgi:hypothetical protein
MNRSLFTLVLWTCGILLFPSACSSTGSTSEDGGGNVDGGDASIRDDGSPDVSSADRASIDASADASQADSQTDAGAVSDGGDATIDVASDAHASDGAASRDASDAESSSYVVLVDGVILEPDGMTPIVDAQTGTALTGMTSVAEAQTHSCATRNDGTVWCWPTATSGNSAGQLGNGSLGNPGPNYRAAQVLVAANQPLTGAASMAHYSLDHWSSSRPAACVVRSAGDLYCWGDLTWIVNAGTPVDSPYAQAITTDGLTPLAGVEQAAIGDGRAACAVVRNASGTTHSVDCWGYGGSDNLGQGATTSLRYPTRVAGLTDPTKVILAADGNGGVGPTTACAIDSGQVLCWGNNTRGACGINSTTAVVAIPTTVTLQSGTALDSIVDLVGSGDLDGNGNGASQTFCALRQGGTLWCWGKKFTDYASNFGVTNVAGVGSAWTTPRYLTTDGVVHIGSTSVEAVSCQ